MPLSGKGMERIRRRSVKIRAALERLGGQGTARQLALETGLTSHDVAHTLRHMRVDGVVTADERTGGHGEVAWGYARTWRLTEGVVR